MSKVVAIYFQPLMSLGVGMDPGTFSTVDCVCLFRNVLGLKSLKMYLIEYAFQPDILLLMTMLLIIWLIDIIPWMTNLNSFTSQF